ncbi:MAG: MMPL family transporter, partial [Acidimicrobiia bacterium]|nr:MMPL family transporter [Acidimicrobiia bacterium]
MSAFLYRLGRSCARHPFRVLGIWLVAAVAVVTLQGAAGGKYDNSIRVPGVEAQRAADVLTARFPTQSGKTARIVFHTSDGRLDDANAKAAIEEARQQLAAGHDVTAVTNPFGRQSAAVSADGTTAYVDVAYSIDKFTTTQLDDATAAASVARAAGVEANFTGELAQAKQNAPASELVGVAVAILVLLIAFGSVVAMGLPILTALMGVFVGAAGVGVLSAFVDVPDFSLILCTMVGLGVGIDYALLVVTRHRQHLHEGMSVEDAAGTANATAGMAVLFAGSTVVIAILGLVLAGIPAISSMGAAIAVVVVASMIAALTLLPGLLGLAGTKIDKLSVHRKNHAMKPAHATVSGRWAHHVGQHPVRYALASFVSLCVIAVPALSMRIGTPDDGNATAGKTQRTAYDQLADGFGRGFNGPIQV